MPMGIQVPFKEMGVEECDSPILQVDGETQTVTRRLLIEAATGTGGESAWDRAKQAYWQLLGTAEIDEDGRLHRHLPQEDWEYPSLYASRVRMQGLAWKSFFMDDEVDWGSRNEFKKYILEVEFTPRPYRVLEDDVIVSSGGTANEFLRFVEPITNLEGQYLSIPSTGVLKWAEGPHHNTTTPADSAPIPGNIGRIVTEENYVFRWHQVPKDALPEGTIIDCVGKVNKTDFGDPDDTQLFFPANKLLMIGAGWRRTFLPKDAAPAWTIEYMFKYRSIPHNNFFDFERTAPGWYQVSLSGTKQNAGSIAAGQCVYDEAEFADLFVPAS